MFCAGMSEGQVESLCLATGFVCGTLLVRYLGLPLITKKLTHMDCLPLIEKFITRIGSWRGILLSYVARL